MSPLLDPSGLRPPPDLDPLPLQLHQHPPSSQAPTASTGAHFCLSSSFPPLSSPSLAARSLHSKDYLPK